MPYIAENWADLLAPGLRKVYDSVFNLQPSNMEVLFNVQSSKKAQEFDLEDGPIGNFTVMSGEVPYEDKVQGYKTTYTHEEYAKGIKVEKKLIEDDLYNIVKKRPAQLAVAAARTRETDAASVLNNAFNSSVTGGDTLPLCSTAHTSLNGGANQGNSGTSALSPTNVEATRRLMAAFKDSSDNVINVQPDTLVVPIALEETAWEIINSKGKVDTAQNNANFHNGKYKLVVWPNYLTSATRWFFCDSTLMKQFLNWFDRVQPEFFRDGEFETLLAKYAGRMRYSFGWSDWRWVYGQNP